jgi:hypothetical protein
MGKHESKDDGKLRFSTHRGEHRAGESRDQQERNRFLNEVRAAVKGGGYLPNLPASKDE